MAYAGGLAGATRRVAPVTGGHWESAWIVALALMAVLALRMLEVFPILAPLRPAFICTFVLFPVLYRHSGVRARTLALRNRLVVLLALYWVWAAIGVPFALYRGGAFQELQGFLITALVAVALLLCAPTQQMLDRLALGFVVLTTAAGLSAYIHGSYVAGRLSSGGSFDPNDLASLMATGLPFAMALALRGPVKHRIVGAVGVGTMVVVLMATGSRGGIIGLMVGLMVLLGGMRVSRAVVSLVIVVLALPVAWEFAPPVFKERLQSMGALEEDYNMTGGSGRMGTWTRGVGYTLSHPVVGVGIGNFGIAEGERLRQMNRVGAWHTAHNAYVQAFAELGIPGGLLFLAVLGHASRCALRLWRSRELHRPEYLAGLAAFSSAAFFLSHAYAFHLFAILGLVAHAGQVVERRGSYQGLPASRTPAIRRRAAGLKRGPHQTGRLQGQYSIPT